MTTLLGLMMGCASKGQFLNQPLQQLTLTDTQNEPNRLLSDCPEQFGIQILALRLTPQYTVLELEFTNRNLFLPTRYGPMPLESLQINPSACLTSPQSPCRFKLLKAEGIPLAPKRLKIPAFTQTRFNLYFERIDPGLEWIDWIGDGGYRRNYQVAIEFLDIHIHNPTPPQQLISVGLSRVALHLDDSLLIDHPIPLQAVYFDPSQAILLADSFQELNQLRDWLQQHPTFRIRFEGHTDIIGDHERNRRLSQERAVACQAYLLNQGIASSRVEAVGYGDQRPLSRSKTEVDRQRNRRVEVRLLQP